MARKFFYVAAALLCLSLAFHFGYTTARAQAPSNPIVAVESGAFAYAANGDVYMGGGPASHTTWLFLGNVFSGSGPTPALHESWGQLKSRYAPKSGPTSQTPTDR